MNLELSEKMNQNGFLLDWAERVQYGLELNNDCKETSEALDEWAKKIGTNGVDADNEIAELVRRAITRDIVEAPDDLLSAMFEEGNIGEFDDAYIQHEPKNTIKAYDAVPGGNVNGSYIDFKYTSPTWVNLQAETWLKYSDLRRGGYKTVANLVTYIKEAMMQKRWYKVITAISAAITSGDANYIAESSAAPTATSADALAVYLMDNCDAGEVPMMVGKNKYILAISKLAGSAYMASENAREAWRKYGTIGMYAGAEMRGISGTRQMADGNTLLPDKTVIGVAGKIGHIITRGETHVYETMNNNAEMVHLKVGGFNFGYDIAKTDKIAKIVMAQ